jgi:DNA-binding NarL/FixJ family response regulator
MKRIEDDEDRYRLSRSKKDAMLPSLRAPTDLIERVRKLCENSGFSIPSLRRQFWIDFVKTLEAGEEIALPPHVMTVREREIVRKALSEKS